MKPKPKSKRGRVKRRKCCYCGKWDNPANMVHTGFGRVMYSEARFAHRLCHENESAP